MMMGLWREGLLYPIKNIKMRIKVLKSIFVRDLKKLKSEIESYKNEKNIWAKDRNITNSAGNLCLHIIGNLNWFIGGQLGDTGYIRRRDLEFSKKNVSKADLLEKKTSTYYFLVHLTTHLAYHLGQINYHRRLLDE